MLPPELERGSWDLPDFHDMPPNAKNSAVVGLLSPSCGVAATRETRLYTLSLTVTFLNVFGGAGRVFSQRLPT